MRGSGLQAGAVFEHLFTVGRHRYRPEAQQATFIAGVTAVEQLIGLAEAGVDLHRSRLVAAVADANAVADEGVAALTLKPGLLLFQGQIKGFTQGQTDPFTGRGGRQLLAADKQHPLLFILHKHPGGAGRQGGLAVGIRRQGEADLSTGMAGLGLVLPRAHILTVAVVVFDRELQRRL